LWRRALSATHATQWRKLESKLKGARLLEQMNAHFAIGASKKIAPFWNSLSDATRGAESCHRTIPVGKGSV
jgi:hypothetical protein